MTEEIKKKKEPFGKLPSSGIWEGREDLDFEVGYLVKGHDNFIIYCGDASYIEVDNAN